MGTVAQQDHDVVTGYGAHPVLVGDRISQKPPDFSGDQVAFLTVPRLFIRLAWLFQRVSPCPIRIFPGQVQPPDDRQQLGPAP